MKRFLIGASFVTLLFLGGSTQIVSAAEETNGFWCDWFGWAVRPVGFCATTAVPPSIEVVTHDDAVVPEVERTRATTTTTPPPEPTIVTYSTTTRPVYEQVTNEYITIQQSGVSQARLDEAIQNVLMYVNARMTHQPEVSVVQSLDDESEQDFVTREHLLRSLDRVSDQIRGSRNTVTIEADFTSPTITNGLLAGLTYVSGRLGIGTTSPTDVLSVDGAIYLAEQLPAETASRLYNLGGDLYWNGSIVTSSTTGNWAGATGDVFRLTGGVGIGTSTVGSTLTVDGTARITGTTTAPFIDAGGQMCNVEAYGAVGDNSTINDAAIAAAIADCPEGGIVYFPMGQFRIANPIVLDRPVTLRGAYAPRWSYSSTPRSSIRADFNSFAGVAVVHVRDRTISGQAQHNNGGRIENLMIDGGSSNVNVKGVYFEGLVRDWKLTDVDISQTSGNGFEAAVGTGSGNPRGFTIRGLSIYSADGHGFRATALNDTYIDDLLAVGNSLRGIYLSSMGETKVANSRAVFNGLEGLYIDGASNNGGLTFTDFSTDRNDRHGVRVSASGTTTITFNGILTRRDGANTSGGSETPYAGIAVIGSPTVKAAPVLISGLSQVIGVDDSGNPPLAPLVGVRVTNAEYVKVDGQLWGVSEAWSDDGGNDFFVIEDDAILKTGTAGSQELFTNERKWQSTSTNELFFGNRVSIGSSTDTRLFNIVAPSEVGARFRDTTNNVIMDMRVEDFQAFIGTFSNHQMRFQTNNTSRLTIDLNGNIGIGTTAPATRLQVDGVITPNLDNSYSLGNSSFRFSEVFSANGVINTSDARLKDDVEGLSYGLDTVLALQPVSFTWVDNPGQGTKFGLIAQDVQALMPEVVHVGDDANRTLGVRYTELIAVVIRSVQELWTIVSGNSERIAELEQRIIELERTADRETAAPAALHVDEEDERKEVFIVPISSESETFDDELEDKIPADDSVEREGDAANDGSANDAANIAEEELSSTGESSVNAGQTEEDQVDDGDENEEGTMLHIEP